MEFQQKQEEQQLIAGLPNDIALDCLIRVPYQFHSCMKSVCHTWQSLISHPSFYQERRKSATSEQILCLVQPLPAVDSTEPSNGGFATGRTTEKEEEEGRKRQRPQQNINGTPQYALSIYNATHNLWQRTRPKDGIPIFCQCLTFQSSGKILLLGGWDPTTLEPVRDVYILDLIGETAGKWRRGAPMKAARSFFACAVVGEYTVYVAGGHDGRKNALKSAEMYNVDRDEWTTLPDMIEERDESQGLAWEGDSRFWVVSGYESESQGQFRSDAECYDPVTGMWSRVDEVWPFGSSSPRGANVPVCFSNNVKTRENEWWWVLGGEQLRQSREGIEKGTDQKLRVSSVVAVPDWISGTTLCATGLGCSKHKSNHRVFVMGCAACGECDGGAFIVDVDDKRGSSKWNHVHTPSGFSKFPYSASYLSV
ncbi:hypothetical protein K2173_019159 [Erythroxylum novogranatense]|uniref:F-box domain-containing protein n=1 Tax=Erythroxylum novogranatense TaxID=1862640 RepID=A0AAV8SSU8_9ROSI|nr:hypothetical protein K2173_019159 [Erythroxylum novogranatense]